MSKEMVKFYRRIDEEYIEVFKRFSYNEDIYKMCVEEFVNDSCIQEIDRCYHEGDREGLFQNCHALKGVAINLGFKKFYGKIAEVTEIYKQPEGNCNEKSITDIKKEYIKICKNIKKYLNTKK